jgi:hypothetical protein
LELSVVEDRVLVPARRAPCAACRELTLHVDVAVHWLCLLCGRDLDSRPVKNVISTEALSTEILIHTMGQELSWSILEALNRICKARVFPISKAARTSPTAAKHALTRLFEANLVLRFDRPGKQYGSIWALNRANPVTAKVLEVIELCQSEGA